MRRCSRSVDRTTMPFRPMGQELCSAHVMASSIAETVAGTLAALASN